MRREIFATFLGAIGLAAPGCFFNPSGSLDEATESTGSSTTTASSDPLTTGGPESCGDLKVDPGEECDAGPTGTGACTDKCTLNECGDGYRGSGEGCDDGNTASGDGCTPQCTLESCGDGETQSEEACDDGNDNPNDACTNLCRLPMCGDGDVYIGFEECDDGNNTNDDACLGVCKKATCGDGFLQRGVEQCDDGDRDDGDECKNDCSAPSCGDGILQEEFGEACDLGEGVNSDEGECTLACQWAFCGDGLVLAGMEECDDANTSNYDYCLNKCTTAFCGDRYASPDEECDHGALNGAGGCSDRCQREGWVAFVTSQRFAVGEDFGSLEEADTLCDEIAFDNLNFSGTFKAWIGDTDDSPLVNFSTHGQRYGMFSPEGFTVIADNWDDLVDGELLAPINVTELGDTVTGLADCDDEVIVWTGLSPDGNSTEDDCYDWTSGEPDSTVTLGTTLSATNWSDAACAEHCDVPARLFCFEQ